VGHYAYQWQKQSYRDSIEVLPLVIFCGEEALCDSLATKLDEKYYTKTIEIDDNQTISEILVNEYGLSEAQEVLQTHSLPQVIKVFFDGALFSVPEKADLRDILLENQQKISWNYNDSYWGHFNRRLQLLEEVNLYGMILLAGIILIFSCYFRVRSEMKLDSFWNIYRSSGGSYRKRETLFWIHSLFLIILPIAIHFGINFYVTYTNLIMIPFEMIQFAYQFGLLLFVTLLSRLFLGKSL
jgi:hypothetical protein